ncbi:hypothetical protein QEZ40_005345 [Streptomyces katrae]|uniref:Uncharacterized protein n=1 Tax=Streptomyces katrae TaxID=68223 RepID=A0ABT7GNQ4_9ACTN|nr:hypothetical protein [Streptomyces katrae]MDK9495220.1 hypothetical protein [Streptomyces katrae]
MTRHPVVVYPPSVSGGRRVRIDAIISGTAYSDRDLIEFLRRAGAQEPEAMAESNLIEWRGGHPHEYLADA